MFESTNNINIDPISYIDQDYFYRPFDDIFNINTPNSSNFFHLPSPIIYELPLDQDDNNDHQFHNTGFFPQQNIDHQQKQLPLTTNSNNTLDSNKKGFISNQITSKISNKKSQISTTTTNHDQIPAEKKGSKRDRHSKINTAQGPRDRRVRLSLKVAKEFFALQDALGFDKASKTVEWLFIKAKPEIKKLFTDSISLYSSSNNGSKSGTSSTSDCEVVSEATAAAINTLEVRVEISSSVNPKEGAAKKAKTTRKASAFNPIDKESRQRARARARERTRKLLQSRRNGGVSESLSDQLLCDKLGQYGACLSQLEAGEESVTQTHNLQQEQLLDDKDQNMIDGSLVVVPSFIFNHLHHFNNGISTENQLGEFQSLYKPWES